MTVNVLGTPYTVAITNDAAEPRLTECDGFCDETTHEIFAEDYKTHKDDSRSKKNLDVQTRKVIRHEIIHAFLFESGLAENSDWAQNEEMVDWFAKQGQKIFAVWREAGALDEIYWMDAACKLTVDGSGGAGGGGGDGGRCGAGCGINA